MRGRYSYNVLFVSFYTWLNHNLGPAWAPAQYIFRDFSAAIPSSFSYPVIIPNARQRPDIGRHEGTLGGFRPLLVVTQNIYRGSIMVNVLLIGSWARTSMPSPKINLIQLKNFLIISNPTTHSHVGGGGHIQGGAEIKLSVISSYTFVSSSTIVICSVCSTQSPHYLVQVESLNLQAPHNGPSSGFFDLFWSIYLRKWPWIFEPPNPTCLTSANMLDSFGRES